jgi:hypothetical protein
MYPQLVQDRTIAHGGPGATTPARLTLVRCPLARAGQ